MDPRFDPFMTMPRPQLDHQLSPSLSAKDAMGVLEQMGTDTRAAKEDPGLSLRRDIPYGPRPRQKLDIFRPKGARDGPLPCLVFLHGGFWQEGDKSLAGYAACTLARMGWAYVSVGYSLTPDVSLSALTQEIAAALTHVHQRTDEYGLDRDRIVLAGHSAGAHLAACVLTEAAAPGTSGMVAGAVLISGVFELAPIARSYVNDLARITPQEVQALSPARQPPRRPVPVHLVTGGQEPAAFLTQSDVLQDLWATQLPALTSEVVPGKDHFDVLDCLQDPGSATMRALRGMV